MGRQLIIAFVALTGLNLGPLGSAVKADTAEVWCFTQQQGQWPTNTRTLRIQSTPRGTCASTAMAFPICFAATNRDKHTSESRRNAD